MKILLVHNFYQQPGGEDVVFRSELELLRGHGHEVVAYTVSNDVVTGVWSRLMAALGVVFSLHHYRAIRRLLRGGGFDVVHVHNFFPLISPSVFYACRHERVPSVFTAHNFRIACPTATLMHDGKPCERSLVEGPWWAVRHRVYKGSLPGTCALVAMIAVHRRLGTWSRVVSRLVTLTAFSRDKLTGWGIPAGQVRIKPNFFAGETGPAGGGAPVPGLPARFVLYVGRLSPEKGVNILAQAWRELDIPLVVVGDGDEAWRFAGMTNVVLLGRRSRDEIPALMRQSLFVVMPSLCYEGFPMVLLEAMAAAKPAVVSGLGGLAEIVLDGVTGVQVPPGDAAALVKAVRELAQEPARCAGMGENALAEYRAKYTPEVNYQQLIRIYEEVIAP